MRKIEAEEWTSVLDEVNERMEGASFYIEEIDADGDKKNMFGNLQFKEAAINIEDGEFNNSVYVTGAKDDGEEINYLIQRARNISVEDDGKGNMKTLIIHSDEQKTAVLEFSR